jgi:hypothetical protein
MFAGVDGVSCTNMLGTAGRPKNDFSICEETNPCILTEQ